MALPIPRLHLLEIDDQSWFPSPLRACVQNCLTFLWKLHAPILQPTSPASLVAQTLQTVLDKTLPSYTFVDFCSGAGGPTPFIERAVNKIYKPSRNHSTQNGHVSANGHANGAVVEEEQGVDFVMTDIHPHLLAWEKAAKKSDHLLYVPTPVDAGAAPRDLLALANTTLPIPNPDPRKNKNKKIFRLFSLAFHHFDTPLAAKIMRNTLETHDGFAIFELQGRDVGNLFTVLMLGPLLWAGSWYWFWGQWGHLFWTYVLPVVPAVVVFDGLVSCLRTRRAGEVMELVEKVGGGRGWRFESGRSMHTWPGGTMSWFIGVKEGG
ncbi:hypothetical protein MMC28_007462 [Mycoblastus sanguinarius]|nr:hypothetical protein [Mycoblastus sanguinarius]